MSTRGRDFNERGDMIVWLLTKRSQCVAQKMIELKKKKKIGKRENDDVGYSGGRKNQPISSIRQPNRLTRKNELQELIYTYALKQEQEVLTRTRIM